MSGNVPQDQKSIEDFQNENVGRSRESLLKKKLTLKILVN